MQLIFYIKLLKIIIKMIDKNINKIYTLNSRIVENVIEKICRSVATVGNREIS